MKAITLLLAVFSVTTAFSQRSGIKADMFAPVAKTLVLAYEKVVSDDAAFQIGFALTSDNSDGSKYRRLAFTPEYRFYLSETPAPNGFFVAPFGQYISVTERVNNVDESSSAVSLGIVAGRQWLFKERVTFGLFFGPGYITNTQERQSNSSGVSFGFSKGFMVRGGVTLGLVF